MKREFFDAIRAGNHDKVECLMLLDTSLTHVMRKPPRRVTHILRLLARNPELVNAFADDGLQLLGLAGFFGHREAAETLMRAGASINTPSKNDLHATPLQSSVSGRHTPIVKMLFQNSAQPNVRERGGCTPLHAAANHSDTEYIQLLIMAGSDLHFRGENGKRPIDLAEENGHGRAKEILKREITKPFRPAFDG